MQIYSPFGRKECIYLASQMIKALVKGYAKYDALLIDII